MAKIVNERALLEQDFIKDPKKKVSEVIKESVAVIGENIQVRLSTVCRISLLIKLWHTRLGLGIDILNSNLRGCSLAGRATHMALCRSCEWFRPDLICNDFFQDA